MAYGGGCSLSKEVSSKTSSYRRCRSRIVEYFSLKQGVQVEVCGADSQLEKEERCSSSHVSQHVEQAERLDIGTVRLLVPSHMRGWLSVRCGLELPAICIE